MKPVSIESPFAGDVRRNHLYLQACIRDCLARGETPYASHQMLTEALDDNVPEQRALGINAGLAMRETIGFAAFYVDLDWSTGMKLARETYDGGPDGKGKQTAYELRRLPAEVLADFFWSFSTELFRLREALGVSEDASAEEAIEVAQQGVAALATEASEDGFEPPEFGVSPEDSAALEKLRACIDEHLPFPSSKADADGGYESAVRYAAEKLRSAQSELEPLDPRQCEYVHEGKFRCSGPRGHKGDHLVMAPLLVAVKEQEPAPEPPAADGDALEMVRKMRAPRWGHLETSEWDALEAAIEAERALRMQGAENLRLAAEKWQGALAAEQRAHGSLKASVRGWWAPSKEDELRQHWAAGDYSESVRVMLSDLLDKPHHAATNFTNLERELEAEKRAHACVKRDLEAVQRREVGHLYDMQRLIDVLGLQNNARLTDALEAITSLRSDLAARDATIGEVQKRLTAYENGWGEPMTITDLRSQLAERDATIGELQEKLAAMTEQRDRWMRKESETVHAWSESAQKRDAESADLREKLAESERRAINAESIARQAREQRDAAEKSCNDTEKENDGLAREAEAGGGATAMLRDASEQRDRFESEAIGLREQLTTAGRSSHDGDLQIRGRGSGAEGDKKRKAPPVRAGHHSGASGELNYSTFPKSWIRAAAVSLSVVRAVTGSVWLVDRCRSIAGPPRGSRGRAPRLELPTGDPPFRRPAVP
jgi:hypothetical protein